MAAVMSVDLLSLSLLRLVRIALKIALLLWRKFRPELAHGAPKGVVHGGGECFPCVNGLCCCRGCVPFLCQRRIPLFGGNSFWLFVVGRWGKSSGGSINCKNGGSPVVN